MPDSNNPASLNFIPATVPNAELLRTLVHRCYTSDHIPINDQHIRTGLDQLLRDSSLGHAWLIYRDQQLAGYTILTFGFDIEFGGRYALITDLYIEPAHRRLGLGQQILEHLQTFCRRNSIPSLQLQVQRDNTPAHSLYIKFGFQPFDRIPMAKPIDC
ncbi:GNAT family N-acetyltransferase [Pedosphaera parvula]|uniref:GCN5-related N-acetyltransferase n=1 Tax=Pedosphaera parvula (strain Ellin514) TaxID=320771 RepID=B9XKL6_PEDPL|nr:GNAT family N-acetyltransferase [Pedosphaera parvula]EEF59686.1 GCN5-related N-acetyltransferase [Pedosphaera parvula Ellin514]